MRIVRRSWLASGVLLVLVAAGIALAPLGLRHLEAFQVRQVEVIGTRFLDPSTVVRTAGLARHANMFDDADRWRLGVLTLPLVETVQVRRRFPAGVEVRVREVEPVALVAGPRLRPVDANGRLVPLDAAGRLLDLPIVTGVDIEAGRLVRGGAVVEALVALSRTAPELAARVSQLEVRGGTVRMIFRDETAEALLPLEPTEAQLRQLRLAFTDLTVRGELSNVRRIDLRFRDQVVVSFLTSPVS